MRDIGNFERQINFAKKFTKLEKNDKLINKKIEPSESAQLPKYTIDDIMDKIHKGDVSILKELGISYTEKVIENGNKEISFEYNDKKYIVYIIINELDNEIEMPDVEPIIMVGASNVLGTITEEVRNKLRAVEEDFSKGLLTLEKAKERLASCGAGPVHIWEVTETDDKVMVHYMAGNAAGDMECDKSLLPKSMINIENVEIEVKVEVEVEKPNVIGTITEEVRNKLRAVEEDFSKGLLTLEKAKERLASCGAGPVHIWEVTETDDKVMVHYMAGNSDGHMECDKSLLPKEQEKPITISRRDDNEDGSYSIHELDENGRDLKRTDYNADGTLKCTVEENDKKSLTKRDEKNEAAIKTLQNLIDSIDSNKDNQELISKLKAMINDLSENIKAQNELEQKLKKYESNFLNSDVPVPPSAPDYKKEDGSFDKEAYEKAYEEYEKAVEEYDKKMQKFNTVVYKASRKLDDLSNQAGEIVFNAITSVVENKISQLRDAGKDKEADEIENKLNNLKGKYKSVQEYKNTLSNKQNLLINKRNKLITPVPPSTTKYTDSEGNFDGKAYEKAYNEYEALIGKYDKTVNKIESLINEIEEELKIIEENIAEVVSEALALV